MWPVTRAGGRLKPNRGQSDPTGLLELGGGKDAKIVFLTLFKRMCKMGFPLKKRVLPFFAAENGPLGVFHTLGFDQMKGRRP